jgi:hypothetical protein
LRSGGFLVVASCGLGSAKAEEGQDGKDDDDGSDEPNDAVHVSLLKMFLELLLNKEIERFRVPRKGGNSQSRTVRSGEADEVQNSDDDHDCSNQPNDAVHDVLLLMSQK